MRKIDQGHPISLPNLSLRLPIQSHCLVASMRLPPEEGVETFDGEFCQGGDYASPNTGTPS